MFSGYRVVHASDSALHQRPESFNRVGVHVALHVDAFRMLNPSMAHLSASWSRQIVIGRKFIRKHFGRWQHARMNESVHRGNPNVFDCCGEDPATTFDSADDNRLVAAPRPTLL